MGADEVNDDVTASQISIMAPCFLVNQDKTAGSANDQTLLYGETTWISGHNSVAPSNSEISSYDVLDNLINSYLDTNTYPNLKVRELRFSNSNESSLLI